MIGFITYSVIIVYLELIFHISVYKSMDIFIIYPVLFAVAAGMGIFTLLNIMPRLAGKLVGCAVVVAFSFYYMAQLIYFKIFNTFLSLVSIGGAENAMNFKSVLFDKLWENIGWIIAFLLPVAGIIFLNVKDIIKNTNLKGSLQALGAVYWLSCLLYFRSIFMAGMHTPRIIFSMINMSLSFQ